VLKVTYKPGKDLQMCRKFQKETGGVVTNMVSGRSSSVVGVVVNKYVEQRSRHNQILSSDETTFGRKFSGGDELSKVVQ
jgi:hypothetical protein